MYDFAVSFLPGLNSKEIDVLFVAVKSALKEQVLALYCFNMFLVREYISMEKSNILSKVS